MSRGRKKKKSAKGELTPLETMFMKVIWKKGSVTAAEMKEELEKKRPLADTTVHTVLANMRKKGFIEPVPTVERALRFGPKVSRDNVAGRSLKKVLKDFFDGSPRRLMAHMIRNEDVDAGELEEIRKMLEESENKEGVQ